MRKHLGLLICAVLTLFLGLILTGFLLLNKSAFPTLETPTSEEIPPEDRPNPTRTVASSAPTEPPSPTASPLPTNTPMPTDTPIPTDTPTPSATPTPSITPTPTERPPSIEIIVDDLTVYQGPGANFATLYTVHRGDVLVVQSKYCVDFEEDPWFLIRVRSDGTEEWISGDARSVMRYNIGSLSCRLSTCPGAPPQRVRVGSEATVCTREDLLLMRRRPNLTGSVSARLSPGTSLTVIDGPICGDNFSWWKIRTSSGEVGWVAEGGDTVDPYFICPAR